jgi:hypothetical protein
LFIMRSEVLAGSGSGEPSLIGSRSEAGLATRESPSWRRETQKGQHPRDHSRPTVRVTDCVETSKNRVIAVIARNRRDRGILPEDSTS